MRGSAVFGVGSNMPFCLIALIEYGVRVSGQGEKISNAAARAQVIDLKFLNSSSYIPTYIFSAISYYIVLENAGAFFLSLGN